MEGVRRGAECAIGVLCHPGASRLALPARLLPAPERRTCLLFWFGKELRNKQNY